MSDNISHLVIPEFEKLEFSFNNTIGDGSEGVVSVAQHDILGKVAVKLFKTLGLGHFNREAKEEIIHIVQCNHHQNIIRFFGYVVEHIDGDRIISGYAMEHMADNSLDHVIHIAKHAYTLSDIAKWGSQAALALSFLHSKGLIHRDVKPKNMLLCDSRRLLKLCDFGITRADKKQMMTLGVGTYPYMAPELLRSLNEGLYNEKVDVYSLGVTIWEMATKEHPRGPLEKVTLAPLRGIIKVCWSENPADRPTMKQLVETLKYFEEICSKKGHTRRAQPAHTPVVPSAASNIVEVDDDPTITPSTATVRRAEVPTGFSVCSEKDDQNVPSVNTTGSVKNLIELFNHTHIPAASEKKVQVSPKSTKFNDKEAERKQQPEPRKEERKEISKPTTAAQNRLISPPRVETSTDTVVALIKPMEVASSPINFTLQYKRFETGQLFTNNTFYNPCHDLVATLDAYKNARIWDLTESTWTEDMFIEKSRVLEDSNGIFCLSWNSNGTLLAAGCGSAILKIYTTNGRIRTAVQVNNVGIEGISAVAWNCDDAYVLAGCSDGSTSVWDSKKEHIIKRFCCHNEGIVKVGWINRTMFASSSNDSTIKICRLGFDLPIRTFQMTISSVGRITDWDYDSPSERMAISSQFPPRLQIYSLNKNDPMSNFGLDYDDNDDGDIRVAWSPLGNSVIVSGHNSFKLLDVQSGALIRKFDANGVCSPDGRYIATVAMYSHRLLSIWDVESGEDLACIWRGTFDSAMDNIRWSSSCGKIVAHNCGGEVLVVDLEKGQLDFLRQ